MGAQTRTDNLPIQSFAQVLRAGNMWLTCSQLLTSLTALIANRMIGTGIFCTPSTIFFATGTPAGTLLLWCLGAVFAYCG